MKRLISIFVTVAVMLPLLMVPAAAHPAGADYLYNTPGTDGSNNGYHLHIAGSADGTDLDTPPIVRAATTVDWYCANHTDTKSAMKGPQTVYSATGIGISVGDNLWLTLQDAAGTSITGIEWSVGYENEPEPGTDFVSVTSNGKLTGHTMFNDAAHIYHQSIYVKTEWEWDPDADNGNGANVEKKSEQEVNAFCRYRDVVLTAYKDGVAIFSQYVVVIAPNWHVEHVYLHEPDEYMEMFDSSHDPIMVPKIDSFGTPIPNEEEQLKMPVYLVGSRKTRNVTAWLDPPRVDDARITFAINHKAYDYLNINPHNDYVAGILEAMTETEKITEENEDGEEVVIPIKLGSTGIGTKLDDFNIKGTSTTTYEHTTNKLGFPHLVPVTQIREYNHVTETASTITIQADHLDPGQNSKITYLIASSLCTQKDYPWNAAHADAIIKVVRSVSEIEIYKNEDNPVTTDPTTFHVLPITKTQQFKAIVIPDDAYDDWKNIKWYISDKDGNEFTDDSGKPYQDAKGKYQMKTVDGEIVTLDKKPAELDTILVKADGTVQAIGSGTAYVKAKSSEIQDQAFALVEILVPFEAGAIFIENGNHEIYVPVGEVRTISVEFYPPNTTVRDLVWWVLDENDPTNRPQANIVASVSGGGDITGFNVGETKVYAETADGAHVTWATIHVVVPVTAPFYLYKSIYK